MGPVPLIGDLRISGATHTRQIAHYSDLMPPFWAGHSSRSRGTSVEVVRGSSTGVRPLFIPEAASSLLRLRRARATELSHRFPEAGRLAIFARIRSRLPVGPGRQTWGFDLGCHVEQDGGS